MSAETFTTAMFLIVAVISAGVMVNAIFPVVHTFTQSVTSSSHSAEERISTDIKVINTYADAGDHDARIWIKNVGSSRIHENELQKADIYIGAIGDFDRMTYNVGGGDNTWRYTIEDDSNNYWDPMETITLDIESPKIPAEGQLVYFAFTMPNGVFRETEFTSSA